MSDKRILIVDDDPDVTLGMHLRLRANHYETLLAADAHTSLAEAKKYPPDLIVLDLGLPAGDGYHVMEELKKVPVLASIPVIVVSARDSVANQTRVLRVGAKAFLQKPVDNDELLEAIRQALSESTGTPDEG